MVDTIFHTQTHVVNYLGVPQSSIFQNFTRGAIERLKNEMVRIHCVEGVVSIGIPLLWQRPRVSFGRNYFGTRIHNESPDKELTTGSDGK